MRSEREFFSGVWLQTGHNVRFEISNSFDCNKTDRKTEHLCSVFVFLKERKRLSRLIDPAHISLGKVDVEREKSDTLSGFFELNI
jgi:hypothetical protein